MDCHNYGCILTLARDTCSKCAGVLKSPFWFGNPVPRFSVRVLPVHFKYAVISRVSFTPVYVTQCQTYINTIFRFLSLFAIFTFVQWRERGKVGEMILKKSLEGKDFGQKWNFHYPLHKF